MSTHGRLYKLCITILIAGLFNLAASVVPVLAATIPVTTTLSSYTTQKTNVNQAISFTVGTNSSVKQIDVRFSTNSGGFEKPANINLVGTTLASSSILGTSGWSLDTSSASSGLLKVNRSSGIQVSSGAVGSFTIQGITNPTFGDCQNIAETLADVCYVHLTTYSDSGTTIVDQGVIGYTLSEDPQLSFEVNGVASGTTHNGIATNVSTLGTKITFGNIQANSVRYAAQKLTIRTNAPHGYIVYARLDDGMKGAYASSEIDPFGATNVSWTTPQTWSSPDGTSPNNNTGWIGANTTDNRVLGWENNTTGKFGPFSSFDHMVARSTTADRTGTDVYVTYALEINGAQPADNYSASIIYNVQASY